MISCRNLFCPSVPSSYFPFSCAKLCSPQLVLSFQFFMLALLCQFSGGRAACESRVQRTAIFAKDFRNITAQRHVSPEAALFIAHYHRFRLRRSCLCFVFNYSHFLCAREFICHTFLGSDKNTINLNGERARKNVIGGLYTDLAITLLFHVNCGHS